MKKKVLYLGWVGFGNLGDDVCRDIFVEQTNALSATKELNIEVNSKYAGTFSNEDLLAYKPDLVVLGGGSLLTYRNAKRLLFAQKNGIPTIIWGSGKDGMNDDIWTGEAHHRLPKSAKLILKAVEKSVLVGLRGPHTSQFLKACGYKSSSTQICGDPGLLLTSSIKSTPIKSKAIKSIIDKKNIIGINLGTTHNRLYGGNEQYISEEMVNVTNKLTENYTVVLFSMWHKDIPAIKKLANQISNKKNLIVLDSVYPIAQLSNILEQCTFTVNFKLHANVFSAAVGTPFISLGYRAKCNDFATSLGLENFVVRTDTTNFGASVLEKSDVLMNDRITYLKTMNSAKRKYEMRLSSLTEKIINLID
ncbi:polysaccharide pyruvyl transferase family protein [Salipaludibacillus sp. HK11]|uniref:polysaccharide pyruvyl transferase family protein n=1 Tax=Salipaludibacillus sp. HK11 TaxID=3394320 RepID=UPI0039FD3831